MSAAYFVDAHCHLTDQRVALFASEWIENALANQVEKMMIGGLDPADWARQAELQKKYPQQVLTSFGLHPWWVEKFSPAEIENSMQVLARVVQYASAVGETGLDFHPNRNSNHYSTQESLFRRHLTLALEHQKPVVLHLVRSHSRALEIVKEMKAESLQFLLHSFSGSKEVAREWIKRGAILSFGGGLLKEGSSARLKEVLALTPLSQLVFETDAPDQAWRADGNNEPCFVREIYTKAAEVLNIPLIDLMQIVAENFAIFG
ncbi:MAG: TatD family hydrolase [Bdellovibrionales bacterium]|nr:TatD family hydrolase [Oligoflexia bacterium]